MFKVGCSGFPVKRGTYDFAYMMFNNASMYVDVLHSKKLLEGEDGQRG
jgi:hypothetical protein